MDRDCSERCCKTERKTVYNQSMLTRRPETEQPGTGQIGEGMKKEIMQKFVEVFGDAEGVKTYFAPGRVNLIGEHTDYNGGHVFPCALTIGTYGAARKRTDHKLRFFSMNFEKLGVIESSLEDLVPSKEAGWTNYQIGRAHV